MKYILVVGGVISGVGKGVVAGSTGALLKSKGYRITFIKIDPYVNIDAGTLAPFDHGEVYVLDDGGETDLDLGNYERFLNISLTKRHNITTGKVYQDIISKERRGEYLGKTVQIVPHVTSLIQEWIEEVSNIDVMEKGSHGSKGKAEICIIELGGTVGDIESLHFAEALRQFKKKVGPENFLILNVAYIPIISTGEQKTKPIQNAASGLRKVGLSPNVIIGRSTEPLTKPTIEKISEFTEVEIENVISVPDCKSIYEVPRVLEEQGLFRCIKESLNLRDESQFNVNLVKLYSEIALKVFPKKITIGIVGKYTNLKDAYTSLVEAIKFSAYKCHVTVDIIWIESSSLESTDNSKIGMLGCCQGVVIPGGFGSRGIEGKIKAAKYCRDNKIPYLGICLGFQIAVIEFTRNVLGIKGATSGEFDPESNDKVISYIPHLSSEMGATMRLGLHTVVFQQDNNNVKKYYSGLKSTQERHRHRYEVNPEYVESLESHGMVFVGKDISGARMEIFELKEHPFYIGAQFHPEYLATPISPHPLFNGFIEAIVSGNN